MEASQGEFERFLGLLEQYLSGISDKLDTYVPEESLRGPIRDYISYINSDQIGRVRKINSALSSEPEMKRLDIEARPLNGVLDAYLRLLKEGKLTREGL